MGCLQAGSSVVDADLLHGLAGALQAVADGTGLLGQVAGGAAFHAGRHEPAFQLAQAGFQITDAGIGLGQASLHGPQVRPDHALALGIDAAHHLDGEPQGRQADEQGDGTENRTHAS